MLCQDLGPAKYETSRRPFIGRAAIIALKSGHSHRSTTTVPEPKCDRTRVAREPITFLHSVLCNVGFPRSRTDARTFERRSGRMSIRIEAGSLFDGREFVELPLPYGSIPRLILMHVSSEAVRRRERIVELGDSTRQFLQHLGMATSGGKRGSYAAMHRQMAALATCRLTLGMHADGRAVTVKGDPIQRFEAWPVHRFAEVSRTLWPGRLELSQAFYDSLIGHAVPLDAEAIAALRHSALGLDIYAWLAHRLRRVTAPQGVMLSWDNLQDQFGQEYLVRKDFKRQFSHTLQQVLAAYPGARVDEVNGGLLLRACQPPVPTEPIG